MSASIFRYVNKYLDLSAIARTTIKHKSGFHEEDLVGKAGRPPLHFKGVLSGNELLGFMVFEPVKNRSENKSIFIRYIWVNPVKQSVEFRRKFGVSPSRYLLEDLVRRGYSTFVSDLKSPEGKRMMGHFLEKGMVIDATKSFFDTENRWNPTENTVRTALSRRPLLRRSRHK